MDTMSHFHMPHELIRFLARESDLVDALFQNRKRPSLRYDQAFDLASRKDESLKYLQQFGVIRYSGDFIELEDTYLKFF